MFDMTPARSPLLYTMHAKAQVKAYKWLRYGYQDGQHAHQDAGSNNGKWHACQGAKYRPAKRGHNNSPVAIREGMYAFL